MDTNELGYKNAWNSSVEKSTTGWWENTYTRKQYVQHICSQYSSSASPIYGSIVSKQDIHHQNVNNYWTQCDGGKLTTVGSQIKYLFNDSKIYDTKSGSYTIQYDSIVVLKTDDDITHQCSLELDNLQDNEEVFPEQNSSFVYNSDGNGSLKIKGRIHNRRNSQYVESYNLIVVADKLTSLSDFMPEDICMDNGHKNGFIINTPIQTKLNSCSKNKKSKREIESSDKLEENVSYYSDENDDIIFNVDICGSETEPIMSKLSPAAKNYTIFLKANYNNDLHPTFHALTPIEESTASLKDEGILAENSDYHITVSNGMVVVNGIIDSLISVYSSTGILIYQGTNNIISLPRGIYIVIINSQIKKVIV